MTPEMYEIDKALLSVLHASLPCVYISGPMTGQVMKNYPAFYAVAAALSGICKDVYNPAARPFDDIKSAFSAYCQYICTNANTIVMLPGWQKSQGARVEHDLASRIGIHIVYLEEDLTEAIKRQYRRPV